MKIQPLTWRALVAVVAITGGLAACGSDDDTATTASAAPATTPPASAAVAGVAVMAEDYAFDGVPAHVAAGAPISLTNTSTKEVHEIVAFHLPDSETRDAATLTALPQAEFQAVLAGAPALVLVAPPGQDGFPAVGDGTLSAPGPYLLICTIPTGADPAAYMAAAQASQGGPVDVPGGPPHFINGMYAETVVG